MNNVIREWLEELLSNSIEEHLSQRLKGWLSDAVPMLIGILTLAFIYSGFADYEHYSSRGIRIFLLPAVAVATATVLYAVCFTRAPIIDSHLDIRPVWLAVSIALPMIVPLATMIWIRERHTVLLVNIVCWTAYLMLIMILLAAFLEAQENWPTWVRVTAFIILIIIGYASDQLAERFAAMQLPPSPDPLEKYAPLGFGRWR